MRNCIWKRNVKIENIIFQLQKALRKDGKAIFLECFGNSLLLEKLKLYVPIPLDDKKIQIEETN